MDLFTEEAIATEGMSGCLGCLGQFDPAYAYAVSETAPGAVRPTPQIKSLIDYRQLVKQAAQPATYTPEAITPGMQAALRARQALGSRVTKAPTPVRKPVAYKMPAQVTYTPDVQAAVTQSAGVPADSNLIAPAASPEAVLASQQQERFLRETLSSNAYDAVAPAARQEAIQKDMARVMAEAEYQRSAQQASQAAVFPQNFEYGPRAPTAEEMFRGATPRKYVQILGVSDFVGSVNAAQAIKAKASSWASSFFGGGK